MSQAQKLTLGTVLIVLLAIVGWFAYSRFFSQADASGIDLANQPVLGEASATVDIVLFESFTCPHCANFEENILPRIIRDYVDEGIARVYYLDFPLDGSAFNASRAASCVYEQSPTAFWDYKTFLYRLQGEGFSNAQLVDVAETYTEGIDSEALKQCIEDKRFDDAINADRSMGAEAGVTGTPSVYVNGEKVQASYADVQSAIEDALNN
jgi:protein-disulfide isomerase